MGTELLHEASYKFLKGMFSNSQVYGKNILSDTPAV